jgi:hypothetical protein
MTGSNSSISAHVLAAYRSGRRAGLDEWTACEKALEAFRMAHPEASSEFANTFVSDVLRQAYPAERRAHPRHVARPGARRPRPFAGQRAAASKHKTGSGASL